MISDKNERCVNCKHCFKCKELKDREWKWFYICDLFMHEKDGWALSLGNGITGSADVCECWEKGK